MASKPTTRPVPQWDAANAERHRQKHSKCFERLLGVKDREVTITEFKDRSQRTVEKSWAEFEADKLDNGRAAYFVDDQLVQAVVTLDRRVFRTCFHQHLDRTGECAALFGMPRTDRRMKFIRYLNFGEKGRVYTGVKRIRGV